MLPYSSVKSASFFYVLKFCLTVFICVGVRAFMLMARCVYRLAPVSNVIFFSKTDNLSKIAIYKFYLEVEVLGTKFDYQRG